MTAKLFGTRSLLFLPASNPRAIEKAREAGADLVILDLEDAVKSEHKKDARGAAVQAAAGPWPCLLAIRVNGSGEPEHDADVEAVSASGSDFIVLPRTTSADEAATVGQAAGKPLIAMIETAGGLFAAREIASVSAALLVGTNDLMADLRLPRTGGREPLRTALSMVILAARASGVRVFDGVFNGLEDEAGLKAECAEGRMLGFDGKSLIHPRQILPCHTVFAPTDDEIARAERLIEAATGGAERFEGEMVERMHVEAARRLIERRSR
ncbi:MAG: HpcH/HpaI aldolase/citrate lyase family protein [Sphingomicrobium sp.]